MDARTRLGRALRESEETTSTDNRVAHTAYGKTNAAPRVAAAQQSADTAQQTAEQAGERAEESIQEAASKLGFIDFQSLIADGKLTGELPGVYIRNVAAEKILAGDIDAEYLNVRGRINVGPVMLDPEGITLPTTGELENPDQNVARKIKPADDWGSLEFMDTSSRRGPVLSGTGVENGKEGITRLVAKTRPNADPLGPSSAMLTLRSTLGGSGLVSLTNSTGLRVDGLTELRGGLLMTGAYAWTTVSPVNGWQHISGKPAQYRITPWRTVQMRGGLQNGDPNVALFFLPSNAVPSGADRGFIARSGAGWASCRVEFGGSATPGAFRTVGWSGATVNDLSLDSVEFSLGS